MLDGIPQDGVSLGDPDAPVTLVEFADLQCPFCAQWAKEALPVYVADYVRTGQMRIEFRPLTFIGNESQSAAEIAVAAGQQGKAWNAIDLIYRNQGAENSGWFSSDFIAALGRSIPGLDADQMLSDAAGDGPQQMIDAAATEANEKGIDSTPSFLLGKTGGSLERVQPRLARRRRPPRADRGPAELVTETRLRRAIAIVALVGVAIAGYLSYVRFIGELPACKTGGCEKVQSSKYSEVVGIPVAFLGLLNYLAILATSFRAGEAAAAICAGLSLAGAAFAGYLLYLQIAVIDAICIWCVASDVVIFTLAVLSILRLSRV